MISETNIKITLKLVFQKLQQLKMQEYVIQKPIGTGSYGYVYLATHKTQNIQYVIKKIKMWDLKQQERQKIDNEVKLLRQFKHINIVRYRDSFIDGEGFLNIVMANCEGGDIYQLIEKSEGKKIDEKQIIDWAAQIALAIYYMHQKRILHRDLKTSNIFLNHGRVRLGDFGISKVLDQNKNYLAQTNIGTPLYMSPQQFRLKPYSYKSDIWAFGCVLYQMCNQKHVFYAQSVPALAAKIFRGEYAPITEYYSHQLRDLIYKMLSQNPKGRPTIIQILQKPFIKRRVHNYIKQIVKEGHYDSQLLQSLLDQANTLNIVIQNQSIQSTPIKINGSKNGKPDNTQKLKKQKIKQKLEQQILKQSEERKKMMEKMKELQLKRISLKRSKDKSKDKNNKISEKSLHQRSSNSSLLSKRQSTDINSNVSSARISKKQEIKKEQSNKKKSQKPYLIIEKQQEYKNKPFKMEQDHDFDDEQQSEQANEIKEQIQQELQFIKKQSKSNLNNTNEIPIPQHKSNVIKQDKNFQQLEQQINLKTQKIHNLESQLQQLQKVQLQLSSDSQNQINEPIKNPLYNRLTQKINDLKHKIISVLGRDGYSKFMKYMLNHNGKQNRQQIRNELQQLVGKNRIGLWHIGTQIVILEKIQNKTSQII